MPDLHLVDEFDDLDLAELRALAPTSLETAAPGWSRSREQIREELVGRIQQEEQEPVRSSWLPRLAVAAAAVLLVGGVGAGLLDNRQVASPAAPVSSSAAVTLQTARVIPAGQYVVRRSTTHQTGEGLKSAPTTTRVDWRDAEGNVGFRIRTPDNPGERTIEPAPLRDLSGMPTDPAGMRSWFAGTDTHENDSRPADEVVWVAAGDLFREVGTSAQLRQLLVGMLAVNPSTTLSQADEKGRRVVRLTHTRVVDDQEQGRQQSTETITLDASTMALLGESSRVTDAKGAVVGGFRLVVTEPEHLTTTRP